MTNGQLRGGDAELRKQRFHLGVMIRVQPLVGHPGPGQELPDAERFRRELRSDDPDRRRGTRHEQPPAGDERGQDRVSEPGIRRHQLPQPVSGDATTSPGDGDPGRDEDPQPAQHVQLAEKPARSVVNDDPLVTVDRDHDVDLRADQDEEVVRDVALPVEVLADLGLAPDPQLRDHRHVGRVERWCGVVVLLCHGSGSYFSTWRANET